MAGSGDETPILFCGVGPVRVGSTVRSAARAAGEPLAGATGPSSGGAECRYVRFQAFPAGRLEVTPHKYLEPGHYFVVRSRDRRHALVMETDGEKVVQIRLGLVPAAEYVEGCS